MKNKIFIQIDVYRGIFSKYPVDTLYELVEVN
nr:MAG TPA: hypothetical protein [Caudoviricetes sp.]